MPVELENIGVPEVGLDFDFAADLLFDFALLEFVLVQDFEGADEAGVALAGEVDATELSLAERAPDLEHAEMELFRGGGLGVHRWLSRRSFHNLVAVS